MTESCYGATFVASLERQLSSAHNDRNSLAVELETTRAEKKILAERLAAVTGERDDLVAQHDQDLQGHGALNARLFSDLTDINDQLDETKKRLAVAELALQTAKDDSLVRFHGRTYAEYLKGKLAKAEADLATARADLKASRLIIARQDELIDDRNEQIEKLRTDLAYTRKVSAELRAQVSGLKDDVAGLRRQLANIQAARESRICVGEPPAPTVIDTVVLTGWNGMTMTTDHNGTILRRTS